MMFFEKEISSLLWVCVCVFMESCDFFYKNIFKVVAFFCKNVKNSNVHSFPENKPNKIKKYLFLRNVLSFGFR